MKTLTPTQTTYQGWVETSKSDFPTKINETWDALTALKETITEQVQTGNITPMEAVGIVSAAASQLFASSSFQGNSTPTPADIANYFSSGSTR